MRLMQGLLVPILIVIIIGGVLETAGCILCMVCNPVDQMAVPEMSHSDKSIPFATVSWEVGEEYL